MSIRSGIVDGVATLEIARPEKKNALTQAMYEQLADGLQAAQADPAVRSVLISGQPGIFTSGNDLEDFARRKPAPFPELPTYRFMQALLDCDKPVIAAVTGPAIGIGTTMLLHVDLVYISDEAHLVMPFVSLGLVPEFGSSFVLPQRLGRVRTAEKLLLGDPIGAQEAVDCGLANAVLPAGEVLPHARRIAERFNRLPPAAVRETKKLLRAGDRASIEATLLREAEVFAQALRGPEAREAFQAFFEKRAPDYAKMA